MVKMKQTKELYCKSSDYTLSQPKALKVSARKHVREAAKHVKTNSAIRRVHTTAALCM